MATVCRVILPFLERVTSANQTKIDAVSTSYKTYTIGCHMWLVTE